MHPQRARRAPPDIARAAALGAVLFAPMAAFAHAGLSTPTPRDTNVTTGTSIKTGPCGPMGPGTGARTPLVAGQTYTVEFIETINHRGYFRVFFSDVRDTNFVIVRDRIAHRDGPPTPSFANPRTYTATITVPNVNCQECTLQLIQVMEDRNPPTNYYSCADIAISGGVVVMPDAGAPDAATAPDALVSPDAIAAPDAVFEQDAATAPDALELAEAGPAAPDAAPIPPPPADASVANPADAGVNAAPTRNSVGGGCSAAPGSELGAAMVLAALAALRRRLRGVGP